MNRETLAVYTIAILGGAAIGYVADSPALAFIAGFAIVGAIIVGWHAGETANNALRDHYAPKVDDRDR
jgi:hypothetical protein